LGEVKVVCQVSQGGHVLSHRWARIGPAVGGRIDASPGEEAIFDELEVGVATQHLVIDVPAFGVGADHDARHPQAKADLVDGWRG
jgi:hypothetical protein